ncbi:MAG TPA: aldo/keto reductase, partial [Chloroflexota bacterium]|nr:aldo/keto reductase [Chloroflexota bacterium]
RSLRLLGHERLLLVHLHDPVHSTFDKAMAPAGPVEVLLDCKRQGVIEHLGVAGGPIDLMIRFVETGLFEVVITHNRYTLLNQSAAQLLDVASRLGVPVLNAAPYGSGMLAKGPAAYARYAYQDASREQVERTRRIEEICERFGVPLAAAALQFSLRDPRVTSTIVGVTRPERIEQTLKLAEIAIPDELWRELTMLPAEREDPERMRWQNT